MTGAAELAGFCERLSPQTESSALRVGVTAFALFICSPAGSCFVHLYSTLCLCTKCEAYKEAWSIDVCVCVCCVFENRQKENGEFYDSIWKWSIHHCFYNHLLFWRFVTHRLRHKLIHQTDSVCLFVSKMKIGNIFTFSTWKILIAALGFPSVVLRWLHLIQAILSHHNCCLKKTYQELITYQVWGILKIGAKIISENNFKESYPCHFHILIFQFGLQWSSS